jgi:hypothetical protein
MIRALRILLGTLAAIVALLMFALALWAATFAEHKVRAFEREHLEAAVKFVRERELENGGVPDGKEFARWAREMDSRGYRFDGYGYALHQCGPRSSEFCIGFWTGDAFVTYRSSQESMESVRIDESPLPFAFGLLAAGLIAGIVGKLLLFPRRRVIGNGGAHEA